MATYYGRSAMSIRLQHSRHAVVIQYRHFNLPYTVVDRVRGNPTAPLNHSWFDTIKRWLNKE